MNKQMKRVLTMGLMTLGIGLMLKMAQAAPTDTMTVSVTPSVTFAVQISSPELGGYDFSTVALGATTVSTVAITLNTVGATAAQFFGLSVSNTAGLWSSTIGAPGVDTFRMSGWVATTQPLVASFVDFMAAPPYGVAASGKFNQSVKTTAGATAKLWLRLEMPTTLSAGSPTAQTMVLTATAQGS
jgi:hypothetical protein